MSKRPAKKKDRVIIPEVVEPVLSRRQEGVIVALLANPTIKDAATAASVSESTVWRLMQREDFQKRYREAQDTALNGALGALQGAATLAIDSLKKNLTCGTPAAEVGAAKAILDYTLKVREQFDHAARIKQLEAIIKAREEADARRGDKGEDED
jgi:DNA-binding MurR/RpiR family transcriptional regulator